MGREVIKSILPALVVVLGATSAVAQEIEVISWVPPYAISQAQAAAQADFGTCDAADGLTRVGLQFWTPNPDGTIKYANHEWYTPTDSDVAWWTNWCSANGITCLLTIYNNTGTWDWNLARSAFGSNRATFVNALISEMDRLGLDGIDLDLEGIGSFDGDRSDFDQFVHDLWVELNARGKILTVDSFHYIWNAPNHTWWTDWVGEVDNIHSMGYEDLFEGGSGYQQYSYQQSAGLSAGYAADVVLMGMPSYVSSWGSSSGRGTTALAHVQEIRFDLPSPTGIAIWDLQLSQWQNSNLWCEIAALKSGVPQPPLAASNLAADAYSSTRIDLAWVDNASDEAGFRIERSADGLTGWTVVGTPAANVTAFSHTGLAPGALHFYRVLAFNGNGIATPSNVAAATTFSIPRTIQFSGRTWIVKAAESSVVGPGPNYFSDKGPDVWVDESDRLHMRIANRDGKWYSTEVITEEALGYGTYTFNLGSRVDQLDPNVVLGLFTWDTGAPEYNYREIDIEFAKWGDGADPTNSQYVVQPWDTPGNLVRFTTALDGQQSTHRFTWEENAVLFASHRDDGSEPGSEIFTWSYTGDDVPPEGFDSGNARINLWLYGGNPPQNGQEVEIIVEAFTFEQSASPVIDHLASSQSLQSGNVVGDVTRTHANDGLAETIAETETNGNPRRRTSALEKTFQFSVRRGLPATFFANAWAAAPSADGDRFVFSYSADGSNFSPMFEIAAGTDDDVYRSYPIGPLANATLWIRVEDTDRTAGNRDLNAVSIDHMFVRTEISSEEPPDSPVLAAQPAGFDQIDLNWTDVDSELGYTIERSDDAGASFNEVGDAGPDVTAYSDTGLEPETSYLYRVSAFNGGGVATSNEAAATTGPAPEVQGLHLADITAGGSSGKRWTSTVSITVHSDNHASESGVTVSGAWSDGRAGSCTTSGSGACQISKSWKPSETSVTFTVTGLAKTGFEYEASSNHVPDVIVINQGSAGKAEAADEAPSQLHLSQNYPNPFNPVTRIEFGLPASGPIVLSVFDVLGTEVKRLVDRPMEAGWHEVEFDGSGLSSGMYVAVIRSGESDVSVRMLLMK